MKRGLAAVVLVCLAVVGCGGSTTSANQKAISELKESEALIKHTREVGLMPARYVAEIEEVCNRYERPLLRLDQAELPNGQFRKVALESGRRLRARFLAQVKSITLSAGAQGKSFLQALEALFEKEIAAHAADALGIDPDASDAPEHLATIEGDDAEESEALHQYESMRHQVGIVRCGL